MRFHEFGDQNSPHIMMIHGGGNSWWNYLRQARILSDRYHVILPTMDGHGEEYAEKYISTEDTADKMMAKKKRLSMEASVILSRLWRVSVWDLSAFLEDFYSVKKPAACR